jgi:thioesterase domain-containing protein/acyl carrier protein
MLEAGWTGSSNLQIITGGEVLPLSLAKSLTGITRALWNHYGPTETSICATRERVLPDAELITLGWPIDNVRIYVLNEQLEQVDVGEIGEIYIGGAGVGRGYLKRPELTARTFIPDPFDGRPNVRMYKTGDLGRMLPDGRLDFQGRADNQIKLRGFRIELEEIESAMREYQGVHASSVQVVEYGADDLRLVGYFLADNEVASAQLRDFLRQRLPAYMLPSELIPLESLPMTINGKIDKEALDAVRIEFETQASPVDIHQPSESLEVKLRTIWQKLLKVRNITPDDDFFDLGGHSLLATRMFAEIEKLTGRRIPLSVLIQNPTVRALAAYISKRGETGWPGLVPLRKGDDLPPLFIAHGLGSNLLLFRSLAEELAPKQPVYGIQLTAATHADLEELRVEAFASRFVEEILAVSPEGPYHLAGHSLGGLLIFEIASQLRKLGKEIGLIVMLDCNFHVAQRSRNTPRAEAVPLKATLRRLWKKLTRFFEGGVINSVWRKILYNQLMFKIWLVRRIHREGTYYPHILGLDPYIALFAEHYQPQPIQEDAVLFVAEDEAPSESVSLGWAQVIKGNLDVQKIPGSHQTIFTRPHVLVLARELTKRLDGYARPVPRRSSAVPGEAQERGINPLLECHGG